MDIIDRASALEQQQRDDILKKVRGSNKQKVSLPYCADCGEEIPKARRAAVENCIRCIDCQTAMEAK